MKFITAIIALFAGSSMAAGICTHGKPQCCSLSLLGVLEEKLDCANRTFVHPYRYVRLTVFPFPYLDHFYLYKANTPDSTAKHKPTDASDFLGICASEYKDAMCCESSGGDNGAGCSPMTFVP